jgi:hypothetical protein
MNYTTRAGQEVLKGTLSEYSFASANASARDVQIGDETIMLGLFSDHSSDAINVPIGRFGNLAARPSQAAPVQLFSDDRFVRPAFLNDMRSRTGFSGSPVWAWYSIYQDTKIDSIAPSESDREPRRHSMLTLIGVHRGQFRETVQSIDPVQKIDIASSMTVVVPAWEISKTLDLPKLSAQRVARDLRPDRIKRSQEKLERLRNASSIVQQI